MAPDHFSPTKATSKLVIIHLKNGCYINGENYKNNKNSASVVFKS